jgi:hypothetical protein
MSAAERFVRHRHLRGQQIDPDAWYDVGRQNPFRDPWTVCSKLPSEDLARRLDRVAPRPVAYGTTGCRKGSAILAGLMEGTDGR